MTTIVIFKSISILVINTLNAIEQLANEYMVVDSDEKSGSIECHFPEEINEKTKLLMDSMLMGLKEIEKKYGKQNRFFLKKKTFFELIIKEV